MTKDRGLQIDLRHIAFTKAPKNMRSLVMSMFLFTNAVSSAIAQAFTPLSDGMIPNVLLYWPSC
jgi:dipeptide/tripeptide permease